METLLLPSGRRRKVSEEIARQLATYIVREDLDEGTSLPNEARLQEMLGVGRTTLREALRLLETQGTITIKAGPGGGPIVRRPRADELTSPLTLLLQMHRVPFGKVLEARLAIAPPIAGLAAQRITDDQLEQLRALLRELKEGIPMGRERFLRNNYDFHRVIAEAADNALLGIFDAAMLGILSSTHMAVSYTPRRQKETASLHEAIVDAITDGDAARAEAALREHDATSYAWFRKKYRDLVDQPIEWT